MLRAWMREFGQQIQCSVIAKRAGASKRSLSANDVMMPREQAAERYSACGVPTFACAAVGSGGAYDVTLLLELCPAVRGGRLAALVGPTAGFLGARRVPGLRAAQIGHHCLCRGVVFA